jgi:hypothetical protein
MVKLANSRLVAPITVLAILALSAGCASEPPKEEELTADSQDLTACELFAGAAGLAVTATGASAAATLTCAEGAVAAVIVSGGTMTAGSAVCLAPAAGVALSVLLGALSTGGAYLTCRNVTTEVRIKERDIYADQTCSKQTSDSLYNSYKSHCNGERACREDDPCPVIEAKTANASNCYEGRKRFMRVCEANRGGDEIDGSEDHRSEAENALKALLNCQRIAAVCNAHEPAEPSQPAELLEPTE